MADDPHTTEPPAPSRSPGALPGSSPRPRAVRLPRGARRRQLVEAATDLFVGQGFHLAGMDDIADLAGVSKPVLYQHFGSKNDLYLAVLRHHVDRLLEGVRAALRSTDDNRGRVRAAIGAIFAYADTDSRGFRLVFQTETGGDAAVRAELERAFDGCIDAVYDLVHTDSGLDPHRSRLLAVGLVGAARVSARHWIDSGRVIPRDEAVATTVALCWGGLARIPRQPADGPVT